MCPLFLIFFDLLALPPYDPSRGRRAMKALRLFARVILVLWAGFWILFAIGSVFGGGRNADVPVREGLKGILAVIGIVITGLTAAYFAWRPPRVAGIASILIGILVTLAILSISGPVGILLITALPPFLSGVLFLICARQLQSQ